MSFRACVIEAANKSKISQERAEYVLKKYDALMGAGVEKEFIRKSLKEDAKRLAHKAAENAGKDIDAISRGLDDANTIRSIFGNRNPLHFFSAAVQDVKRTGTFNVAAEFNYLMSRNMSMLANLSNQMRDGWFLGMQSRSQEGWFSGLSRRTKENRVINSELENYSQTGDKSKITNPLAKEAVEEIEKTLDFAVKHYNDAGADVNPEIHKNGRVQVTEDAKLLAKGGGKREYVENAMEWGDPNQKDPMTNQPFASDKRRREYYGQRYDHMVESSLKPKTDMSSIGKTAWYLSGDAGWDLKFKDGDSALAYRKRYSQSSYYEDLHKVLEQYALDTALMRRFGPNVMKNYDVMAEQIGKMAREGAAMTPWGFRTDELKALTHNLKKEFANDTSKRRAVRILEKSIMKWNNARMRIDSGGKLRSKHEIDNAKQAVTNASQRLLDSIDDSTRDGAVLHNAVNEIITEYFHIMKAPANKYRPDNYIQNRISNGRQFIKQVAQFKSEKYSPNAGLILGTIRLLQTGAMLGSAALSSITDLATAGMARRSAGIGGQVTADNLPLRNAFLTLGMLFPSQRKKLIKAGILRDKDLTISRAMSRFDMMELDTNSRLGYAVDRILAVSGISGWTEGGKAAFSYDWGRFVVKNQNVAYDKLNANYKQMLQRNKISAAEWDKIRATRVDNELGIVSTIDIAEQHTETLASKFHAAMLAERQRAILEANVQSRAFLGFMHDPGSWGDQLWKTLTAFKTFPALMVFTMADEISTRYLDAGGGLKGIVNFRQLDMVRTGVALTLLGGLSLQLKEGAKGWGPQEMFTDDPKKQLGVGLGLNAGFVKRAFAAGGAVGLAGDLWTAKDGVDRYGGGLDDFLLGPAYSNLAKPMFGISMSALKEDWEGAADRIIPTIKRNIPGQSLWWLRAGTDQHIADAIDEAYDPVAFRKRRRLQERWRKENYGSRRLSEELPSIF